MSLKNNSHIMHCHVSTIKGLSERAAVLRYTLLTFTTSLSVLCLTLRYLISFADICMNLVAGI